MVKISSVINDLGIDKTTFFNAYEKAFSKKLSDKTYVISEKNLEVVKEHLSGSSNKTEKIKNKTKKKETHKVLKGSELLGGGGFFSGLGFAKKEVEKTTKIEEKNEKITKKEEKNETKK